MKEKLIILCFGIFFQLPFISAQIEIEKDSLFSPIMELDDVVGKNKFTNKIPQLRNFKWTRKIIEMTDGWESAICDQIQCYTPPVSEREIEIGPNASSVLDVHVYTYGQYSGYALIEMKVAYASDPNTNVFAYYTFDSALSSTKELSQFQIEVYPNPSAGLFTLEDPTQVIHSLRVFDLAGKQLMNLAKGERQWINLSKLKAGNYWIQMMDKDGSALGTKMISKI